MTEAKIVGVLPGGGWIARHLQTGNKDPVIGWVVGEDGIARALVHDGNGRAFTADRYETLVYHLDADPNPEQDYS